MFNVEDKVIVNFQGINRLGIIEDLSISPVTKDVVYMVYIKYLNIYEPFSIMDLKPYVPAHISTTFSKV